MSLEALILDRFGQFNRKDLLARLERLARQSMQTSQRTSTAGGIGLSSHLVSEKPCSSWNRHLRRQKDLMQQTGPTLDEPG